MTLTTEQRQALYDAIASVIDMDIIPRDQQKSLVAEAFVRLGDTGAFEAYCLLETSF